MGGILDTILQRLAAYIEKNAKLVSKVKGAMVYPTTIMAIAFVVIIIMLVFVIPVFSSMFEDFGGELPGLTAAVVSLSDFLIGNWYLLLGVGVGLFYAFKKIQSHR